MRINFGHELKYSASVCVWMWVCMHCACEEVFVPNAQMLCFECTHFTSQPMTLRVVKMAKRMKEDMLE